MKTGKISEVIFNMVLFLAGILLLISAQSIEVGAAMGQGGDFLPKLCSLFWVIISGLMLASSVFKSTAQSEDKKGNITGFLLTLLLLFLYVLLLKPIGFVITSSFYMFLQMMLFVPRELIDKKRLLIFVVVSVLLPVLVNLLFANVFSLILPAGVLK